MRNDGLASLKVVALENSFQFAPQIRLVGLPAEPISATGEPVIWPRCGSKGGVLNLEVLCCPWLKRIANFEIRELADSDRVHTRSPDANTPPIPPSYFAIHTQRHQAQAPRELNQMIPSHESLHLN